MANVTTMTGSTITITLDGTTDWVWSTDTPFPNGLAIKYIHFHPSGANDVMIVHEQSVDGAEIFRAKCSGDTDDRIHYLDGDWKRPVIDASDCTLGTAANARVTIELD